MQAYLDREAKTSLYALLDRCHPAEAAHLLGRLRGGQVDGQSQLSCPIGIVAGFRGSDYAASGLSGVPTWPMERWVRAIGEGGTPNNNRFARLMETWLVEWMEQHTLEPLPSAVGQHEQVRR